MKKTLAVGLLFLLLTRLSTPSVAQSPDAANRTRGRVAGILQGSLIDVRLVNAQQVRGLRGEMGEDGFLLLTGTDGKAGSQQIAFADVRSVKVVKSHTTRNVLIGVGVGVLVLAVIVAVGVGHALGGLK